MDVRKYGETGAADAGWYVVVRARSSSRRSTLTHWRRIGGPFATEQAAVQAMRRMQRNDRVATVNVKGE